MTEKTKVLTIFLGNPAAARDPAIPAAQADKPLREAPIPVLKYASFEAEREDPRWGHESSSERAIREWLKERPKPAAKLDLHGNTRAEAFDALENFLAGCLKQGHSLVRVVHGEGLGILRRSVRGWLAECGCVLSYAEEWNRRHSLLVQLKRMPPVKSQ